MMIKRILITLAMTGVVASSGIGLADSVTLHAPLADDTAERDSSKGDPAILSRMRQVDPLSLEKADSLSHWGTAEHIVGGFFIGVGGISLVAGLGLTIGGLFTHSPDPNEPNDIIDGRALALTLGALGLAAGGICEMIGIPVWRAGTKNAKEAQRLRASLSFAPSAVSDGTQVGYGAALVGRF